MRSSTLALLSLILLLAFSLSFLFYSGPFYNFDDTNYITYAHQMLVGTFSIYQSTYTYGLLFLAILALAFKFFGYGIITAALPNFIEYILIVIFTFMIGKTLKGDNFGLIAAFVAATSPYIFGYSTRVLPDMLTGLLATISLYALTLAMTRNRGRHILFLCSGAFAALTIYSKFTGLLYIGFVSAILFVIMVLDTRNVRKRDPFRIGYLDYACFLIGETAFFLAYLAIIFLLVGNPFYAFSNYSSAQSSLAHLGTVLSALDLVVLLEGGLNIYGGISPLPEIFLFGALFIWCIAGTIIAVVRRDKKFLFISTVMWTIILYLFLGTISISSYSSIVVVARYLILIAAPISLMAAYAFSETVLPFVKASRTFALALGALLACITIMFYISPYLSIQDYNLVVSTDTAMLSNISAYANMESANAIFVSSPTALEFMDLMSGYTNNNTHLMEGTCTYGLNDSILIAFYNGGHGSANSTIMQVRNWTGVNCTLVPLKSFLNPNGKSIFIKEWGFNISAEVYRIK